MRSNVIFRASNMVTAGHFVNKLPKKINDLKWQEMRSKVFFGAYKMAGGGHIVNKSQKQNLHIDLKWR